MTGTGVRVLITGGGGFIGSHLVRALVLHGARITLIRRDTVPLWRLADLEGSFEQVRCRLDSPDELQACFATCKPDIVMHLAALLPSSGASAENFEAVNVTSTHLLAEAAASSPVRHFISFGSMAEYGEAPAPLKEDTIVAPNTDYGRSKLASTTFLAEFSPHAPFSSVVVRPSAVFGSAQSFGMFVPNCIRNCIERASFYVPSERRDFIPVSALIDALLRLLTFGEPASFTIFNIGNGTGSRLQDIAETLAEICGGVETLRMKKQMQPPEHADRWLDVGAVEKALGWKPPIDIRSSLQETAEWYLEHQELFPLLTPGSV